MRKVLAVLALTAAAVLGASAPSVGQVAAPEDVPRSAPQEKGSTVTFRQASRRIAKYKKEGSLALLRKSPYRGFRAASVRSTGSRCELSTPSMGKRRCYTHHRVTWTISATGARAGRSNCARAYSVRRASSKKLTVRFLSTSCDPRPRKPRQAVTPAPANLPTAPVTAPSDPVEVAPLLGGIFPPSLPSLSTAAASRSNAVAHAADINYGRGWFYGFERPHPVPQECTATFWHTAGFWWYACGWYQRPLPGLGVGYYQMNIDYVEFWYAAPGQVYQHWISWQQKW
jgi:hypothetical protein